MARGRSKQVLFMKLKQQKWKEAAIRLLPLWTLIFAILLPVLDVAAYWQEVLEYKSALTTLLRLAMLGGTAMLGFWLSDRKRYYWMLAAVLGGFGVLRSLALMQADYHFAGEDLRNLLFLFMLPVYTLSFCTFLRKNPRVQKALFQGFGVDFFLVTGVMLLSWATGTDPYTYTNKQLGIRGWFLQGNAPSAILSMLVPMAVGWALRRWPDKTLPVVTVTVIGETALYFMATRLSSASILGVGFGIGLSLLLLVARKNRRQGLSILAVTMAWAMLLTHSPMAENQQSVDQAFSKNQEQFNLYAMMGYHGLTPERRDERLAMAYNLYVPGLISTFGPERTMEIYDRTTDTNVICSRRTMRLNFCRLLQEDSPESAKWFGMDITRMKVEGVDLNWATGNREYMTTSFDPENDFHAVYYLYGMVGLFLMLAFFAYFAGRGLWAMCRDFKTHFTPEFAAVACACCTDLAHCIFTSSTLRRLNTEAYLAMVLALLWWLSRKELSPKRMKIPTPQ